MLATARDAPRRPSNRSFRVEGVQGLHRLVFALQFVIPLRVGVGVRLACGCLELTGLSALVGTSYGTDEGLNAALEQVRLASAAEQRAPLLPRALSACEDAAFQPAIGLVTLETVSGFVVLREYAADRTAATWTQAYLSARGRTLHWFRASPTRRGRCAGLSKATALPINPRT